MNKQQVINKIVSRLKGFNLNPVITEKTHDIVTFCAELIVREYGQVYRAKVEFYRHINLFYLDDEDTIDAAIRDFVIIDEENRIECVDEDKALRFLALTLINGYMKIYNIIDDYSIYSNKAAILSSYHEGYMDVYFTDPHVMYESFFADFDAYIALDRLFKMNNKPILDNFSDLELH